MATGYTQNCVSIFCGLGRVEREKALFFCVFLLFFDMNQAFRALAAAFLAFAVAFRSFSASFLALSASFQALSAAFRAFSLSFLAFSAAFWSFRTFSASCLLGLLSVAFCLSFLAFSAAFCLSFLAFSAAFCLSFLAFSAAFLSFLPVLLGLLSRLLRRFCSLQVLQERLLGPVVVLSSLLSSLLVPRDGLLDLLGC